MAEKLLPCPFCGGEANQTSELGADCYSHWVICQSCGAKTLTYYDSLYPTTAKKMAKAAWNRRAQLIESQRREKAAVEDMKRIVDAVRKTHCDETCCFACKYDCDTSVTWTGDYANECPGFDRDDCFEWRGLQKAGEGENNA